MSTKAAKVYRMVEEVKRLTDLHLKNDEEDAPSAKWWTAVEQLFAEWHKGGEPMSKLLATDSLRSEFSRLHESIESFDDGIDPEVPATIFHSLHNITKLVLAWPMLYNTSRQPAPIAQLIEMGLDYRACAQKWDLTGKQTGIGDASLAEQEHKNPGSVIKEGYIVKAEQIRLKNREVIEKELIEPLKDAPVYESPEIGSDVDRDRFYSNFDELSMEELVDHARSLGLGVRSNMKRDTVLGKIYSAYLLQEGVEDESVDSERATADREHSEVESGS